MDIRITESLNRMYSPRDTRHLAIAEFLNHDRDFPGFVHALHTSPAEWFATYCALADVSAELQNAVRAAAHEAHLPLNDNSYNAARGLILLTSKLSVVENACALDADKGRLHRYVAWYASGCLESAYLQVAEAATRLNGKTLEGEMANIELSKEVFGWALEGVSAVTGVNLPLSGQVVEAWCWLVKRKAEELDKDQKSAASAQMVTAWPQAAEAFARSAQHVLEAGIPMLLPPQALGDFADKYRNSWRNYSGWER